VGELALALLGAAVVALTWASVITTVVVPRRSRARVSRAVDALVNGVYRTVTRGLGDYASRDRWLASRASATILAQLVAWLVLFYVGFALMLLPFDHRAVGHAFAQAGSSMFTLGYAGPNSAPLTAIDYVAAATGMIVVALQVGYLPTLYAAFNRRETEVTLLVSRAGSPPWGPEILARTRFGIPEGGTGVDMAGFYEGWERWAADVAESHTNYPILTRFRSPHELSSWLVALLAVLDSAALWLALAPGTAPTIQCRLCLRMGFTALRSIAASVGLEVDEDPDPDSPLQLSYDEFRDGVDRIASTSFSLERSAEQAWPDFRGWRVNYESVAYALADRLDAVPGPWTGPRSTGDKAVEPKRPQNRLPTPYSDR
jgi:succinate dehydrogenase hydrophobic anchor subunit